MKKILAKLTSCICVFAIMCSSSAFAAEKSGAELYSKLESIANLIRDYGLYSSENDNPIKSSIIEILDKQPELFESFANAMLQHYDKYSRFTPDDELAQNSLSQNSYVGIGISVQANENGFLISSVLPDSPADKAGVCANDYIVAVDGKSVNLKSLDEVCELIQGSEGTSLILTVRRDDKNFSFSITRELIATSNVNYYMVEDGIAYIKLSSVSQITDYIDFCKAYDKALQNETKALILDLRGNRGGMVNIATSIINQFIPKDNVEFAAFTGKDYDNGVYVNYSDGTGIPLNRIIVLVDKNTASAAELIAGSLRDTGYATIVGTKTYGKAVGQSLFKLTEGTVALTSFSVVLPSGENYNNIGLTPNIYVENTTGNYPMPSLLPLNLNTELYLSNYSDLTAALNQRLSLLGFLDKPDYLFKAFDNETLRALKAFQVAYGLPAQNYASKQALSLLDKETAELAATTVIFDKQMDKAIELAREVQNEELLYTFDIAGDPVAK